MTAAEIDDHINKSIRRSQHQILERQKLSEAYLRNLYRKAHKNIAKKVLAFPDDPTRLEMLYAEIENEIWRMNKKITGIIQYDIDKSINTSIRGTSQAVGVAKDYYPKNYNIKATGSMFNSIYHEAVKILQTSVDGLSLSSRIWEIHEITLREMRRHIARSMLEGKPLSVLNQELRRFLLISDVDMRKKYWKEFFKAHPPGKGVYRSAYKNVERVLRTETLRAYRVGVMSYAKQAGSWCRGVKWNLSAAHPEIDICDEYASVDYYGLGAGVYTPDAAPDSAHSHCLCYYSMVIRPERIIKPLQEPV